MTDAPPPNRRRALVFRFIAAAGLAALVAWLVGRLVGADTAEEPDPATAGAPPADATPATAADTPRAVAANAGLGAIAVHVEACRGVGLDDAVVVATRGGERFTAPIRVAGDGIGDAIVELPSALAELAFDVTLHWQGWVSPPSRSAAGRARVVACPGAALTGRVLRGDGAAVPNARLELLDRSGARVAMATSAPDGAYTLEDPQLRGARIALPELEPVSAAGSARRDILPLQPLERRGHDVLVGGTREVVGWVLDADGDPAEGVSVSLSWEATLAEGPTPRAWVTRTDGGGAFAFLHAPPSAVRVHADGGLRGAASVRVNALAGPGGGARRDVTLVLEPTASLRVSMPSAPPGAVVVVRSVDALAHGGVGALDTAVADGAGAMVSLARVATRLAPALSSWDDADPEASMATVALAMLSPGAPAPSLRLTPPAAVAPPGDAAGALDGSPDGGLDIGGLEAVARNAARRAITEHPETARFFGRVARRLREGMDPLTAFGTPGGAISAGATVALGDSPEPPSPPEPLTPPARKALIQRFGGEVPEALASPMGPPWAELAHGRVGEWIPVKAGFTLEVSLRAPGVPGEIACGAVLPVAGELVELSCGASGEAILNGRAVDAEGRPLPGASVSVGERASATAGPDGRFSVKVPADEAEVVSVRVCGVCEGPLEARTAGGRRGVGLRPGVAAELGDVPVRPWPKGVTADGAVSSAGAVAVPADGGWFIETLDEGGWMEMQGVSPGDVIVKVGDEDAARVDAPGLARLLGGTGSAEEPALLLLLRTVEGELYPAGDLDARP